MFFYQIFFCLSMNFPERLPADGDHGRGSGTLSSTAPLDRESHGPLRMVPLVVGDAMGRTRTVTVTVTVADKNDNPARPGVKTVHVTRLKVTLSVLASRPSTSQGSR